MTLAACELITDDAALSALEAEWCALHARLPDALPFLSPHWLLPWWRVFGTGMPRVATLRIGGRLAGLLPLYRLDAEGERKFLPLGIGVSDYAGTLLEPDLPPGAASALLATALTTDATRADWPALVPVDALCTAEIPSGWRADRAPGEVCPALDLAAPLPSTIRRKISMSRNRAARRGGMSVETADAASAPALLEELIRLHGLRWRERGEAGVLSDPRVLAFHRAAIGGLAEAGVARLQALRIGGEIACMFYLLLSRTRVCAYLGGFDPAFAFESPGTLLFAEAIADAAREGRRVFDFLRGTESYKYLWGAVDCRTVALHLVPA